MTADPPAEQIAPGMDVADPPAADSDCPYCRCADGAEHRPGCPEITKARQRTEPAPDLGTSVLDAVAKMPQAVADLGATVNDLLIKLKDARLDIVNAAALIHDVAKANSALDGRLNKIEATVARPDHRIVNLETAHNAATIEASGRLDEVEATVARNFNVLHDLANSQAVAQHDERIAGLNDDLSSVNFKLEELEKLLRDKRDLSSVRDVALANHDRLDKVETDLAGIPHLRSDVDALQAKLETMGANVTTLAHGIELDDRLHKLEEAISKVAYAKPVEDLQRLIIEANNGIIGAAEISRGILAETRELMQRLNKVEDQVLKAFP